MQLAFLSLWILRIADNLRDNLFEPFFSSKAEGRGLGLAIVAKIAGDLRASVEIGEKKDAHKDCGAKFTIRLPMVDFRQDV